MRKLFSILFCMKKLMVIFKDLRSCDAVVYKLSFKFCLYITHRELIHHQRNKSNKTIVAMTPRFNLIQSGSTYKTPSLDQINLCENY